MWVIQRWQCMVPRNSSQTRLGDRYGSKKTQVLEQTTNPLSGVYRKVDPHWENWEHVREWVTQWAEPRGMNAILTNVELPGQGTSMDGGTQLWQESQFFRPQWEVRVAVGLPLLERWAAVSQGEPWPLMWCSKAIDGFWTEEGQDQWVKDAKQKERFWSSGKSPGEKRRARSLAVAIGQSGGWDGERWETRVCPLVNVMVIRGRHGGWLQVSWLVAEHMGYPDRERAWVEEDELELWKGWADKQAFLTGWKNHRQAMSGRLEGKGQSNI